MWKDTENRGGGDWGTDIGKDQHQISRIGNRFEVKLRRTLPPTGAKTRAMSLSELLPNVGGPEGKIRKLFNNVVHSVALYAAPVWIEEARTGETIQRTARLAEKIGPQERYGLIGSSPLRLRLRW